MRAKGDVVMAEHAVQTQSLSPAATHTDTAPDNSWLYGGLAVPAPGGGLQVFRQHRVTSVIEYKDVPAPAPGAQPLTARQAWGLDPVPGQAAAA
jgi:hypothetical protein